MATEIVVVEASVVGTVRQILAVARSTLQQHGTHLPTAVLHTLEGVLPIVLPFKNDEQKRALVEYVKKEAIERHAFAVTTITCARVVDSRTGSESEALVLATAIQGGGPYTVVQHFSRHSDRSIGLFGELTEGDEAAMPGQMIIFPDWQEEVGH